MKYLNIIKKIEIDGVRKKKKSKIKFMSKEWIIRHWWLIIVVAIYSFSLVFLFSQKIIYGHVYH